jgi:hypothetical protein
MAVLRNLAALFDDPVARAGAPTKPNGIASKIGNSAHASSSAKTPHAKKPFD